MRAEAGGAREIVERENMISRNDDPAATGADFDETRKAWRFRQRLRHKAR